MEQRISTLEDYGTGLDLGFAYPEIDYDEYPEANISYSSQSSTSDFE
jgi:hypothetical protein